MIRIVNETGDARDTKILDVETGEELHHVVDAAIFFNYEKIEMVLNTFRPSIDVLIPWPKGMKAEYV